MRTWEYYFMVMDLDASDQLSKEEVRLNEAGKGGWEVIQILTNINAGRSYHYALLKRPTSN